MDHLQLGLTLSMNHGQCLSNESLSSDNCGSMKKRTFEEVFDNDHVKTLPLFRTSWENDPNEEEDDEYNGLHQNDGDFDENEGIVGWPPINEWRKKLFGGSLTRNNICGSNVRGGGDFEGSIDGNSKSTRIKVKMEGVGIGRKVDLSLHDSYHSLAHTLLAMFGIDEETMKHYELTYQDIDGDWLLAGDVPWSTFLETALRLKLVRRTIRRTV